MDPTGDIRPFYETSIQEGAEERVVSRYPDGTKEKACYYVGDAHVGTRWFTPEGSLDFEMPSKDDRLHGWQYRWYPGGALMSAEPYENGLGHGTAYQWAEDGTLMGSYTLDHGTGIDLWWEDWPEGPVLQEVRYLCNGFRHGWEWWISVDQESIYEEHHFCMGEPHGISREWNSRGRLRRGFPCYFVHGERVTKRQYLALAGRDPSLPPFRAEENEPQRTFPSEVARHLRPRHRA